MTQGHIQFTKVSERWCVKTLDPENEFECGKAVRFRKKDGSVSTVELMQILEEKGGYTTWSIGARTPWGYWPEGEWDEDDLYQVTTVQGYKRPPRKQKRAAHARFCEDGVDHEMQRELTGHNGAMGEFIDWGSR